MVLVRCLCIDFGLLCVDLVGVVGLIKFIVSLLVCELIVEGWLVEWDVVVIGDLGCCFMFFFIDLVWLLLFGVEVGIEGVCVVVILLIGEV